MIALSDKYFVLLSPQERIRLARQVEKAEYRNFQACLHNSWIEQAAAALEIELEEDMYKGVSWVGTGGCIQHAFFFFPFSFYLKPSSLLWPIRGSKVPFSCHLEHACLSMWARLPGPFLCVSLFYGQSMESTTRSRHKQDVLVSAACSLTVIACLLSSFFIYKTGNNFLPPSLRLSKGD